MTGKLTFENNKWKISFENEKGDTKTLFCATNVFSQNFDPSKEVTTEVEFERDDTPQKNACKVRPKDQKWQGQEIQQTVNYNRQNSVRQEQRHNTQNQKNVNNQPRNNLIQSLIGEFHNPYNFVPAVPRGSVTGELADSNPHGHDRYISDKLSGKLTVKMTVKTPLVAHDTAQIIYDKQKDHRSFPVRVGADGKPFINQTAVKGMLRSAYEAITNSRMSIFTKHEDRLAFRPEAGQGAFVVPVRIEEENDIKKIIFYTGTNEISDLKNNGSPQDGKPLCAAWLPRYFDKKIASFASKYKDGVLPKHPKHKDEVKVYIEKFEHYKWRWYPGKKPNPRTNYQGEGEHQKDFVLWGVRETVRIGDDLNAKPSFSHDRGKQFGKSYYRPLNEIIDVEGIILVSNHNMQSKHDEKVFFKNSNSPEPEILSDKKWNDLKKAWEELIENYRAEHEKVKGKLDLVPDNLRIGEWSRHIQFSDKEKELKPNTLCFAEVEKNENKFIVKKLFPVMISRQLFDCSPLELIEKDANGNNFSLISATDIDELSPADRVFGCVIQNSTDKKDKKKVNAYRGQVRVGTVELSEESAKKPIDEIIHKFESANGERKWLPMNILGQPKPQQGRFYVAETKNGEAQKYQWNNENAGYKKDRGLRGRKVYPHHADLPKDYWFEEKNIDFGNYNSLRSGSQFREYLRPPSAKQQNNQNRSIEGWIKPETEFVFDIHFTNLSEIELGALIWLLRMNNEGENKFFQRFGGGKPFGFGSVKLELDEAKSDIRTGKELAEQRYLSLDDDAPKCEDVRTNFVDKFVSAYQTAGYENIIESFKSACKGFDDKKPIHYPRTTEEPNSEGKNFDWFVANTRGRKLPLPNLSDEIGLPRNP